LALCVKQQGNMPKAFAEKWIGGGCRLRRLIGRANSSIAPAVFVDASLEAPRRPRRAFLRKIASRAGHTGAAAVAGVWPFPRPPGVIFTDPAGISAEDAREHTKCRSNLLRIDDVALRVLNVGIAISGLDKLGQFGESFWACFGSYKRAWPDSRIYLVHMYSLCDRTHAGRLK
jgi:hypothetical protein